VADQRINGMRFRDQVALVTGGAQGIGAATVEAFAREGARVVIADIQDEKGQALAERLRANGAQVLYVHANCTQSAEVDALVSKTVQHFGGLHIAANVLGGGHPSDTFLNKVHNTSEEAFDGTMAITLRSCWLSMKYEVLHMMNHGGGAIVNCSSMAGVSVEPHAPMSYGVAKAGLNMLTRHGAVEYGRYGIRVNAVMPNTTATPLLRSMFDEQQISELVNAQQIIPRAIEAHEQADAIMWLASTEAAMITGHILPVDGGRNAFGSLGPSRSSVGAT
jgi:NAD(P)-dependent dehydrogenase (short-subunit alcohol dehydrogenase family)